MPNGPGTAQLRTKLSVRNSLVLACAILGFLLLIGIYGRASPDLDQPSGNYSD